MSPLASSTPKPAADPSARRPPPVRRALLVANPVAGRGQGAKAAEELRGGLRDLGVHVELHLTRTRGDGRARVRCLEPGIDLVVSVGGDGTLAEVLDGLVDPEVPVAALPLGTANVLSLDLGLPRDVDGLLEAIAGLRTTRLDVADVNGRLSFLVTGVGFDGHVVRELEARRRGPITPGSYLGATLRGLRGYRAPRLTVELDGERLAGEFGLVLASNIVHYGGLLTLRGPCLKDDGLFEIYLFEDARPLALAAAALRGLVTSLPGGRGVRMQRARRLRVTSPDPVPYQVDGDWHGTTPVELCVTGRQHRIIVP